MSMSYLDYRIKHRQHQQGAGQEKPSAAPSAGSAAGPSASETKAAGKKNSAAGSSFLDFKVNKRNEQIKNGNVQTPQTYSPMQRMTDAQTTGSAAPSAGIQFDRSQGMLRRRSNQDAQTYMQNHQNWNPYAPKGAQQRYSREAYNEGLASLAQQAGAQKSKRYGDYMKDSAEAMGRKIDLPGFGMRYPGLAAQEYGKRHSDLDADTEYIRNKQSRNLSGASDAVRPGEEGNEIFKGRGILAPNDRILQNAMLSDDQKRTYNYIYATQGAEEAEKFRDTALEEGGVNAMIAQKAFDADLRNSSYPGKLAATYVGAVEGAADSLAGVPGMVRGEEQYRPRSTAEYFTSEAVRSEPEGSLARTGLELAQSAGTNTLAHLASVAGGPALGSAVFAAQAGARAYNDSLMEGHTVGEATAYGAMQALDEEITNYLLGGLTAYGGGAVQRTIGRTPIAQMVGRELQGLMQTETGRYAMRQLMDAIANNSGEAAQEYLQHFTEEFEKWVAYNHTSYDVTTPEGRAALANDLPTRQQIAASLTDPEALHEALIGFLNAGIMNAPAQVMDAADIMNRGRNDIGGDGYTAFANGIDVNPLNYSDAETYHTARDLRSLAQEYSGRDTTTFERGLFDRAAEDFANRAAQDPRQNINENVEDINENVDAPSTAPTTEQVAPSTIPEAGARITQEETSAAQEAPANEAMEQEAPQAEQQETPQEPVPESAPTESAASLRGTTLEDMAQAAGTQQSETREAQRQAIVDTAENLDSENLAAVMNGATMLSEAEKQAAYQEGMNNAVTHMRMEAQNEGSGLSGEGSGRAVSLRTGEQNGGVSQAAGGTAESWTDWSAAADSSLGGRDGGTAAEVVETERGTPAEKFLRTATPGQTIYRIKRGSTPSMRKASAMIKKYGGNLTEAPFASSGDIMTSGGESARAFADPSTRTIGYRINSEDAESDKLVRHELVEFGIMDGKVDVSDALKTLSDRMNEVGLGNYVNIISSAYAGGSTSGRLTGVQTLEAMRHANKEMLCDISAGINQFKGVRGYEDIAEVVDVAHEIFSDYMNERLGGAFDAEADTDEEILEDANISVNESGTVAHIEYSTKYSWKTDEEIERAVEALQRSLGVSKKKARAFVESERTLTNLILSPGNVAAMDYEADDRYKAIKKNSDYPQGTVDFNNNCRKRVPFTSVFNRLQMRNPNRVFTAQDLETIRQTLIKDKIPVACALCYVEERRQRLGEIANSFVNLYNNNGLREQFAGKRELPKIEAALEKVGDDPYKPTISDLITYEGLRKLSKEHAGIAEAFEIFNNARGMQAGRLVEGRAEYKRELLKLTKAQVKRINDLGGLRVFSYSDFEAVNLLDIVQIIQDAAVMGIKIQAYTKVPAFAKVVRNTGIKLNRSLIAAGTGVKYENGRAVLDLDPVEGIDINDPDFFDSIDDRDVGNILVGMSDEQIRLAMTSPFVDYIIPFHTSLPNTILKAKGIDHWTNYKLSQTDKDMKTGKNAKNINIYTEVLQAAKDEGKPIRNKRQFVEKFLQVAKEKNLIPRFSQFLNVDKNGNYVYTEGYHKFLIDFKLFDKNGNIVEQEVVRPEFDDAFNTKLMEDFANGAGTTAVTDAIYNDVVNALNEQSDGSEVQYSSRLQLSGQKDSDGTELTASQADYFKNSKVRDADGNLQVMYHGTNADFNVFDTSVSGGVNGTAEGFGIYLADRSDVSDAYGDRLIKAYVNVTKPASSNKKTITRSTLKKLIKATAMSEAEKFVADGDYETVNDAVKDSWISNYTNTYEKSLSASLDDVANQLLRMDDNDMGIIQEVMAGMGIRDYAAAYDFYDVLKRETGFDGFETWWTNAKNQGDPARIVLAFDSNQVKNIDNENPTDSPDIRYSSKLKLTDELLADLIEKYGALPKGENAQVDVSLPAQTSPGKKTRRYARTVLESGLMSDQMSDEIKKKVINEALSYEPMTDKASAEYAASVIRIGGVERAQREWDKSRRSDTFTKDDMAVGQFLLKEYASRGDLDNVLNMVTELAAEGTRMGQNIQAMRMLKKYAQQVPEIGLGYIQRTVDQMNRDAKKKMGKKYKEMKISPVLASEYLNANTPDAVDAALGKIYKNLGEQVQKTTVEEISDRLRAWRYLSMLGNPRTHVRNLVGNAIFVPAVKLKNVVGAELEKAMKTDRTKSVTTTAAARAFARQDALEMRDVLQGNADKSIRERIMDERKTYRLEALNTLTKANGDALETEDWWFLRAHYQDALAQYITANNLDTDNMDGAALARARKYAVNEAQKATYRDANAVSTWLSQGTKTGKAVGFIMEGMLPFKKTPTNILRRGVEYSPAGLVATLTKGTHDLNTGKITVNEYIDGIASGLSGTAIFGVGMFLASAGVILGDYDDDDDKERRKLRGDQEYSVRIGDYTYTVDWAAPGSLPLFVGVEVMNALKKERGVTLDDISKSVVKLIDPMINMSMLSGLNDTLNAISYSDNKLPAIASEAFYSLLGQFVPTILGQVARTVDTTQRINYQDKNTGIPKDMLYFMEKVQNKIPLMTFSNDPYLNEFGQENVTESRFIAAFQNFISPGYISRVKDDKVLDELDRLSEAQDEDVLPKKMPKYLDKGENRIDLTSEQYTTFQRTAGQLSYNILDNMVDDPRYGKLTVEEQAEAISAAYSYAKAVGRIAVQPEYENKLTGTNKKVYNAVKSGKQAYDAILDTVTK